MDKLPCCEGHTYDLPSSWSADKLLRFAKDIRKLHQPDHGDRRQRRAMDRLGHIIRKADPEARVHSDKKLQELFSCLNEGIFEARLTKVCRPVFHQGQFAKVTQSIGKGTLGYAAPHSRCLEHQRVFAVEVHVFMEHPLGELLETLLHEMCHAFEYLHLDVSKRSCFDHLFEPGCSGHGRIFRKLLDSAAGHVKHTIGDVYLVDVNWHLELASDRSRELRQRIRKIYEDLLEDLPERKTYKSLRRALNMRWRDGSWLRERIKEGRNILEIIW